MSSFKPRQKVGDLDNEFILETENLTKDFLGYVAVQDVNLRVRRGSIHSLIGPNGAGKTTCFNLITKFIQPSSGRIFFNGQEITRSAAWQIPRFGLARSFQISTAFPQLTVLENVRIALQRRRGHSFDFWRSKHVLESLHPEALALLREVGLDEFASVPAGALPYGRKRALEIATTLALRPEMLLLDEPMAGMSAEDIEKISSLIQSVSASRTILMVEHNLNVVAKLSHAITVLARGGVLAEGSYEEVANDPRVREAYMGTDLE